MKKFFIILKREILREIKDSKIIIISVTLLAILLITLPLLSSTSLTYVSSEKLLATPYFENNTYAIKLFAVDQYGNSIKYSSNLSFLYNNHKKIFIKNFITDPNKPIIVNTNITITNNTPPNGNFIYDNNQIVNLLWWIDLSISLVFIQSSKNISMPGIALLVSSLNGSVPSGLSLYINNSYAGSPNQYGFIVAYGIGNVTIKYGNNTLPLAHLSPINSISSINVKSLINSVASSLITFFVPIAGIIAGYDSIAKDKVSGALELIISRPVKRETIYWAKTLGTFISILILFLISIIIFYITALNYGLVLSILNLIAIFVSVAFLSFIFILIESFSGFFSKSLSTPIIWGIVIWIFFNMIYSIITLGVALATSTNILSLEFIKLSNIVGLGNPIDVAKFITYFSLPNAETLVYGINLNIVVVASILWVIIPTMIYLYLMRKYD